MRLIDELLAYPDVRQMLSAVDPEKPTEPVLPVAYVRGEGEPVFHYFSIVSTLGTAQDVTLRELRVESSFPADAATERHARGLAASVGYGDGATPATGRS
jgi:hypothetical protein